jgi:protein SCO1
LNWSGALKSNQPSRKSAVICTFKFRIALFAVLLVALLGSLLSGHVFAGAWHGNYFPNVELTNQDGKTVRFYDDLLKGKIVVIDLIYTNCQYACPLETARLAQVQRILGDRVGKDIFFYSISIDPRRDTPKQLKEYAEKFHAGPSWLFLTGKKEDIDLISTKLGLYSDPDPANKDGHTPDVLLGNEVTGQWIKNSALDNPHYLAVMIGDWLDSWKKTRRGTSYTEAKAIVNPDQGKQMFKTHCAACHTVGRGDSVGPDLLGVTKVRDRGWLARFIMAPDKVLAANDPIAQALYKKYKQVRMPNPNLRPEDVNTIVRYVEVENDAFAKANAAKGSEALQIDANTDNSKMDHSTMHQGRVDPRW